MKTFDMRLLLFRYFENHEITNDSDKYTITGKGDLIINEIVVDQYNGKYECRAKNSEGESAEFANLTVVTELTIEHGPKDFEAEVKSTVRMNCSVLYDPKDGAPTITWKKDGEDLHIDNRIITMDVDEHFLTIRNLTFGDQGKMFCFLVELNHLVLCQKVVHSVEIS